MKVLFAASEAVPFCKTGGLADVAGALPAALAAKGHDVRLVLPKYRAVDLRAGRLKPLGVTLRIPVGDAVESAALWSAEADGVPVVFVDAPKFFERDGLYVDAAGKDFVDGGDRFILFSRAVLEAAKALDFRPDIVHAHDWQTGLVPAYLDTLYSLDSFFLPTASVFTIHNIAFQGVFSKNTFFDAGFSWSEFTPDRLEFFEQVSFLKSAIVTAHAVNTVSPSYAREVAAQPEFGRGLEGVLRRRGDDFTGILNGLDTALWNPAKDPLIAKPFSARAPAGRAACKADLQKSAGLRPAPRAPLFGFVSRLDRQKGVDIALECLEVCLADGCQAVFLGGGDPVLRGAVEALVSRHPGAAAYIPDFNEPMAHRIYAGSDMFLMPSRFEPCGLGQLIALRYGAVPIVTPTGGLLDTVVPRDKKGGTGFVSAEVDAASFRSAMTEALSLFRADPAAWKALSVRGMSADFGWKKSVDAYASLYRRALDRKGSLPR